MGKRAQKRGGKSTRYPPPPPKPVDPPSSDEELYGKVWALIACVDVLERESIESCQGCVCV